MPSLRNNYLTVAILIGTTAAVPNPKLEMQDNLSEPMNYGFCLDLKGWGETTTFDSVHMHSCKPDGDRPDGGIWGSEQ